MQGLSISRSGVLGVCVLKVSPVTLMLHQATLTVAEFCKHAQFSLLLVCRTAEQRSDAHSL